MSAVGWDKQRATLNFVRQSKSGSGSSMKGKSALAEFCRDLCEEARSGRIDPVRLSWLSPCCCMFLILLKKVAVCKKKNVSFWVDMHPLGFVYHSVCFPLMLKLLGKDNTALPGSYLPEYTAYGVFDSVRTKLKVPVLVASLQNIAAGYGARQGGRARDPNSGAPFQEQPHLAGRAGRRQDRHCGGCAGPAKPSKQCASLGLLVTSIERLLCMPYACSLGKPGAGERVRRPGSPCF